MLLGLYWGILGHNQLSTLIHQKHGRNTDDYLSGTIPLINKKI